MKKLILPLLLCLALLGLLLLALLPKLHPALPSAGTETDSAFLRPSGEQDRSLAAEEEVLALFAREKQAGAETFSLPCEEELFRRLTAENARLLSLLQVRGGIGDAELRLHEEERLISFSRVRYTDDPWADCASEEELGQAVQRFLSEGAASFRLLCSPELAGDLARSGRIRLYAARAGYEELSVSCYTNGVVLVQDPKPFDLPWALAEDMLQFDAAVEAFSLRELDEFYILFDSAFARRLADEEERALLHASSVLDRCSWQEEELPGLTRYYRVSYSGEPELICRSEADVTRAVSRMGILGHTSFRLYLEGEELRAALMDTAIAYFHAAESWGGIVMGSVSHSDNTVYYRGAYYTDARFSPEAASLSTPEEAAALLEQKLAAGETAITLFCSPELYEELLGAPGAYAEDRSCLDPLYDLIARSGVPAAELSACRSAGAIGILLAR